MNAQTTTSGALSGVVTDQIGAVIPAAHVQIKDIARGTTQSAITDRQGTYQFFFLLPGSYELLVAMDSFREEKCSAPR
ncbi:MAG: carboxypeptidase-like regulatory domain-containing protein [Acidobacteriia bacterium]|nr:carboxypeptidase-like regulatory domain-containing protein [Terriglobia bacterium]